MFSPAIKNDVTKNTFPVFAEAEKKIGLGDLRRAFRFHYDNTDHDPYLHSNGKELYRPVSIFRTTQTHIMQVREDLPVAIGEVTYVAFGMADLSVFVPFYQGATEADERYTYRASGVSDDFSAYWTFRKVATLGMTDYNFLAPIIKKAYLELETEFDEAQKDIEAEYLATYKDAPSVPI
jgi:dipeptidase